MRPVQEETGLAYGLDVPTSGHHMGASGMGEGGSGMDPGKTMDSDKTMDMDMMMMMPMYLWHSEEITWLFGSLKSTDSAGFFCGCAFVFALAFALEMLQHLRHHYYIKASSTFLVRRYSLDK